MNNPGYRLIPEDRADDLACVSCELLRVRRYPAGTIALRSGRDAEAR